MMHSHHDARPWHQHPDGGAAAGAAVAAEPLSALQRHRLATVLWMERDETPADEFAGLPPTLNADRKAPAASAIEVSGFSLYPTPTGVAQSYNLKRDETPSTV